MAKIFKNNNNELRSGWKLVSIMALYIGISFVLQIILGMVLGVIFMKGTDLSSLNDSINNFIKNSAGGLFLSQFIDAAGFIIALIIMLKAVDKKSFRNIGLTSIGIDFKDFGAGLLFGAISFTAIFIVLLLTKNISLQNSLGSPKFSSYTCWGIGLFILVGFKEELLSRGYSITALNQMKRPWLSILISSLMFSALHLLNPNVKALGLINIVFVGILFGYMFVKTNNLWMPIGYHITWNYFQGNVFGFAVSGNEAHGIYNINVLKDNILTGGAFGPEAGILTTIVIAIGILVVWSMPKRNVSGNKGYKMYENA
ncbi:CAAX amino terminal protease family protein [Clostridiales bacterium oral taxon 876 str. F0540]|nr:CAAX amino terminal protease family protein [Clostridiales bacterium oral taxon 876 str. F0540]